MLPTPARTLVVLVAFTYITNITAITVFPFGDAWKYNDSGTDLNATTWYNYFYDDTTWTPGYASFGVGTNQYTTITAGPAKTQRITYYFRKTFNALQSVGTDFTAILTYQAVDGVVWYLNGAPIARVNMPSPSTGLTTASTCVATASQQSVLSVNLGVGMVLPGDNILAAEVHRCSASSTKSMVVLFDAQLDIAIIPSTTPSPLPSPTPAMPYGSSWYYLDTGTDLTKTTWKTSTTTYTTWAQGVGPFGTGTYTSASCTSMAVQSGGVVWPAYYFRKDITVTESKGSQLVGWVSVTCADGAVVYLNGNEIARMNMATGTVKQSTLATGPVTGNPNDTSQMFRLSVGALIIGSNKLAIELHPATATSTSVYVDLGVWYDVLPTPTISVTKSITTSKTQSVTITPSVGSSLSATSSTSFTMSATPSSTGTAIPTFSTSKTMSKTPTITTTATVTSTISPSLSGSVSASASMTATASTTVSPSQGASASNTPTTSPSPVIAITVSPSPSLSTGTTPSVTTSVSVTPSVGAPVTPTPTQTTTPSSTATVSPGSGANITKPSSGLSGATIGLVAGCVIAVIVALGAVVGMAWYRKKNSQRNIEFKGSQSTMSDSHSLYGNTKQERVQPNDGSPPTRRSPPYHRVIRTDTENSIVDTGVPVGLMTSPPASGSINRTNGDSLRSPKARQRLKRLTSASNKRRTSATAQSENEDDESPLVLNRLKSPTEQSTPTSGQRKLKPSLKKRRSSARDRFQQVLHGMDDGSVDDDDNGMVTGTETFVSPIGSGDNNQQRMHRTLSQYSDDTSSVASMELTIQSPDVKGLTSKMDKLQEQVTAVTAMLTNVLKSPEGNSVKRATPQQQQQQRRLSSVAVETAIAKQQPIVATTTTQHVITSPTVTSNNSLSDPTPSIQVPPLNHTAPLQYQQHQRPTSPPLHQYQPTQPSYQPQSQPGLSFRSQSPPPQARFNAVAPTYQQQYPQQPPIDMYSPPYNSQPMPMLMTVSPTPQPHPQYQQPYQQPPMVQPQPHQQPYIQSPPMYAPYRPESPMIQYQQPFPQQQQPQYVYPPQQTQPVISPTTHQFPIMSPPVFQPQSQQPQSRVEVLIPGVEPVTYVTQPDGSIVGYAPVTTQKTSILTSPPLIDIRSPSPPPQASRHHRSHSQSQRRHSMKRRSSTRHRDVSASNRVMRSPEAGRVLLSPPNTTTGNRAMIEQMLGTLTSPKHSTTVDYWA